MFTIKISLSILSYKFKYDNVTAGGEERVLLRPYKLKLTLDEGSECMIYMYDLL